MTMSGDLKLTPKMALTYNTGYDFRQKEITMTEWVSVVISIAGR